MEKVLVTQNLFKKFGRLHKLSVRYALKDMIRESVGRRHIGIDNLRPSEFWAVNDISFELNRGESLGIIGNNGCGKTTLLKMVSGIFRPDKGSFRTSERIVPLFAKGIGFDRVLTGRENIAINLALFGLNPKEAESRMEEVIDFAELPVEALEAPIKGYSSGMLARLGFACAISTRPGIMIIDEALAVGDFRFRAKCYRRLTELRSQGTSFLMVSHGLNAIIANCDMALYMADGKKVAFGPSKHVASMYEEHLLSGENPFNPISISNEMEGHTNGSDVRILNVGFVDLNGLPIENLRSGDPAIIRLYGESAIAVEQLNLCFIFKDLNGDFGTIQNLDSLKDNVNINVNPGKFSFDLKLNPCSLRPGLYSMKFYLTSGKGVNVLDAVESFRFKVKAGKEMAHCLYYQPRDWALTQAETNRQADL